MKPGTLRIVQHLQSHARFFFFMIEFFYCRYLYYLCSQNETDSDNCKNTNGSLRRVPDGFAKLAEP